MVEGAVRQAFAQGDNLLLGLLDQNPLPTSITDTDGAAIWANEACRKLFGIGFDERTVGGYNLFSDPLIGQQDHVEKVERVFKEGAVARFVVDHKSPDTRTADAPEGAHAVLDVTIFPVKDADEKVVAAVVQYQDITDHKRAEAALEQAQAHLVQSEKMASIGQLAAGVAHEINNPTGFVMSNIGTLGEYVGTLKKLLAYYDELTGALREEDRARQQEILSAVEALREQEDVPYILEDVEKLLSESAEGAERIRDIVRNLKSFARVEEAAVKEADVDEGIEATLKIVWNELKYKCEVHKELGEVPRTRCNPGQLNQVFVNLLLNAAQAISERGDVTIRTEADDGEVLIRVTDTGRGIPPDNLRKVFDPFFTTKDVGKGTGLGLSISHGIVEKHGGKIEVESEVGKGTTFTVRLPIRGADDE